MKNIPNKTIPAGNLRQQAEELLKNNPSPTYSIHSEAEALKLVHELEVHQLELEMQNEEILKAQIAEREAFELYDLAPTSYFTLSKEGRIVGLNRRGARMLQKSKKNLTDKQFGFFVTEETKPAFNDFLERVFTTKVIEVCKIVLLTFKNTQISVSLTGTLGKNQEQCLVTAILSTESRQQEENRQHEHELYQDIVNNQLAGIYRIQVFQRDKWWKNALNSSENPLYKMEVVNDRFCTILGITRKEFEDNPAILADLIHPDDKSKFSTKSEEANTYLIPFQWDGRLLTHDRIIWVHLESIPKPLNNGNVLWTGILYDITGQKQHEEELIESEERFQQLFNKAPLGYQSLDSEGNFIVVNQMWSDFLGFTREEVIGKWFGDFLSPEYKDLFRERFSLFKAQGHTQSEFEMVHKNGTKLVISFDGQIGYDLNGNFKQTHCILQDITQRRIDENELKKSQEDFKDLFDNAPVGYHEIDSEGRIVRINRTELTLLGYESEELVGQYIWKYNANENYSLKSTKEKLQGRQISPAPYERELLRKNGSKITVLQHDRVLWAEDGSITGIRSSVQDITERKQAELDLQLSEEKFRNLFEHSIVGKSMTSIDGKMNVNKAFSQIIGYSEAEMLHLNWVDFTHPDDIEFNKEEIKSILNGDKDFSQWEKRYIHKNGNIIWVVISLFLLRDKDGNPIRFITEIYDITDRKKSEIDLRNSEEKFKKAFLTSPDSITINRLDDGVYVSSNIGFTRIMGYLQDEVAGKTTEEIHIWEKKEDRNQFLAELKAKGIVENFITPFRAKSGKIVYGMISASVIELEGVKHILSIIRDITAIRETESALHQSEERFKVLFEDAPDSMFVADPETWKIIDANKAACKLFKKEKHELVGLYQQELHPERLNAITERAFNNHISQLESQDEVLPFENRILCSDGTEIPVEILAHSINLNDKILLLGTFRNITERKKAEEALRESEELYHNLVLRIPDGVYKSTAGGKFIDVNPAMVKMLGYESKEELLGIDITSQLYFNSSDRDYNVLNGQNEEMSVFPLKKKDGSAIWIEDHGWYNTDTDGKVITHEGVLRDITDRKLAQDALQESESILKKTLVESTGLIDKTSESINYEKISDTILAISGAKYVSFNIFDDNGLDFTTVAVSGIKKDLLQANTFFGFDILNKKWTFDPTREEKTKDNPITRFESFAELTSSSIPKEVTAVIEKTFNIGHSFVVKISKNNRSIGDFTLIYSKEETLRNNELVLLFANQVALYIDRDKSEKALRINEEKYRYLFENNPQPMYIYDEETLAFLEVNQAAIDQYGYSKEEFFGKTLPDIRPPEDIPALLLDVQNISNAFKPAGIWRHTKKNGEVFFVEITTVAVISNGRNAQHVMVKDITERKRAENSLKESISLLNATIESTADGILVIDRNGRIALFNQKFVDMWNVPNKMLDNRDDEPLLNYILTQVKKQEYFINKIRFINSNPELSGNDQIELLDGRIFDRYSLPHKVGESIVGRVWSFRDITLSKVAEEALRVSEEKFRAITEQIDDFITISDSNGIITFGSPASRNLFQYEPEEMYGHHFLEFVDEESLPVAIEALRAGLEDRKKAVDIELKLKRKDGSTFFGELNGTEFINGNQRGSLFVLHDITSRKQTIELLKESEEKFRSIAEQTSDLISITDANGVIKYASNASTEIFQYEPDEMCAHNFTEFLDEESIGYALAQLKTVQETNIRILNLELKMKRKDGSIFYGELNGTGFMYGKNRGYLVVIRDMSERKRGQEELEEKMNDLIRFQNLTVDRELTMIALKKEVNELLTVSGQKRKYKIVK